jgi:hypothetical protein
MDKPVEDRMADTNIIELKKLLHCLVNNGYKFEGTREAEYDRFSYPDDAIADFSKDLDYNTDEGYINDSSIKVSIHFEKRADYTNFAKNQDDYNQEDDNLYVGNPEEFITHLIEEIELNLVKNGGGKKRGKKRKTQKRQKSI